jgi:hypothetical protein
MHGSNTNFWSHLVTHTFILSHINRKLFHRQPVQHILGTCTSRASDLFCTIPVCAREGIKRATALNSPSSVYCMWVYSSHTDITESVFYSLRSERYKMWCMWTFCIKSRQEHGRKNRFVGFVSRSIGTQWVFDGKCLKKRKPQNSPAETRLPAMWYMKLGASNKIDRKKTVFKELLYQWPFPRYSIRFS